MSDFAPIDEALAELRAGRMIVLVDDEDRENEGDLMMAAEHVTAEAINFVRLHTGGVICAPMSPERADALGLPPMTVKNTSQRETAYTVSVDARAGISTGISAADRAVTVRVLADPRCAPDDLVRPGHVFPLRAKEGGVLQRTGHTEASVDLCRLAGLRPVAVISEIMNPDGTMARLPQLREFRAANGLKLASIADLVEHRRRTERLIEKVVDTALPTRFGKFRVHLYKSLVDDYLHIALCAGDVGETFEGKTLVRDEPVLVRVHSECLTGDIFHSRRCDCGEQMEGSMRQIASAGRGVFLYIRQEGRGIGLVNKLKAYALQEQGLDTVEANERLGLPADLRTYGLGAQILFELGVRKMRLLTNNPRKIISLRGFGLEMVERVPVEISANRDNVDYLRAKRDKLGHLIEGIDE
jgi:3,4-dihydroxy 2-butanone 4-phosphate synthase/GTP cyclohydrolase II